MWINYVENMPGELQQAFWESRLFYAFIASLIYLWVFEKSRRKTLVYPTLILLGILFNPWMYWYIWRPMMNDYAFARLLWMLPVLPVIVVAVVDILGKAKKKWLRAVLFVGFCLLATQGGMYIYRDAGSADLGFVKATNQYHLPDIVIETSDYLLDQTDTPRVVVDMGMSPYMRQYSSHIQQFAGRYLNMYSGIRKEMADMLMSDEMDLEWIHEQMAKYKYEWLVVPKEKRDTEYYESKGFHFVTELCADGKIRNIYKMKYLFSIEPNETKFHYNRIPVYCYSGKEYLVKIENVELTDGETDRVSVLLYDSQNKEEINHELIELDSKGTAKNVEVRFRIPNNESHRDRYRILLYAGVHGHTENIGVTYSDVSVEEIFKKVE